jgi:hypothetical protein
MDCNNIAITKYIVKSCRKYSFFGIRFGPKVTIKIAVNYHKCGKFTSEVVEGPKIKNIVAFFKKEIDELQKEIVKDLTFAIRRKQILENHKTKTIQKIQTDQIHRSLDKAAFDELTTRMRKNKTEKDHPCLIKKEEVVTDEQMKTFENYFGDTSKIVNRRTKI